MRIRLCAQNVSYINDHGVRFKDDIFLCLMNEKYSHTRMQRFSLNSPHLPSKVKKEKQRKNRLMQKIGWSTSMVCDSVSGCCMQSRSAQSDAQRLETMQCLQWRQNPGNPSTSTNWGTLSCYLSYNDATKHGR